MRKGRFSLYKCNKGPKRTTFLFDGFSSTFERCCVLPFLTHFSFYIINFIYEYINFNTYLLRKISQYIKHRLQMRSISKYYAPSKATSSILYFSSESFIRHFTLFLFKTYFKTLLELFQHAFQQNVVSFKNHYCMYIFFCPDVRAQPMNECSHVYF